MYFKCFSIYVGCFVLVRCLIGIWIGLIKNCFFWLNVMFGIFLIFLWCLIRLGLFMDVLMLSRFDSLSCFCSFLRVLIIFWLFFIVIDNGGVWVLILFILNICDFLFVGIMFCWFVVKKICVDLFSILILLLIVVVLFFKDVLVILIVWFVWVVVIFSLVCNWLIWKIVCLSFFELFIDSILFDFMWWFGCLVMVFIFYIMDLVFKFVGCIL